MWDLILDVRESIVTYFTIVGPFSCVDTDTKMKLSLADNHMDMRTKFLLSREPLATVWALELFRG